MSGAFQIHGYFEDLFDVEANKCIGTRSAPADPTRELGFAGRRRITITEDFVVTCGHRTKKIRIRKPTVFETTLNPICGKTKWTNPQETSRSPS